MITKVEDAIEIASVVERQRHKLHEAGLPETWADVGVVFSDQYIRVVRDPVRFPSGSTGTHLRVQAAAGGTAGAIVVARRAGRHLMVVHDRYVTGRTHIEYPRGMADAREDPARTAERELAEETGWTAARTTRLGTVYADTGMLDMPIEVYAIDATPESDAMVDTAAADEGVRDVLMLTPEEIRALIVEGAITDGLTLAAFAIHEAIGLPEIRCVSKSIEDVRTMAA